MYFYCLEDWSFLQYTNTDVKNQVNDPSNRPTKLKNFDKNFICLECGAGLLRGSDFFRKQHFQQMHPDIDEAKAVSLIVEANHELAIRKRKKAEQSLAEENSKES